MIYNPAPRAHSEKKKMSSGIRLLQNATWTISNFVDLWQQGRCIKPLIQRKIRWDLEKCRSFVEFLIEARTSGNPLHVNRKVVRSPDGQFVEVYIIFDGNNRSNAILEFVVSPLMFRPEWIPQMLSEQGQDRLRQTPLRYLQSNPMNLLRWCGVYKGSDPFVKKIPSLQTELADCTGGLQGGMAMQELNNQFDGMLSQLGELSFFDIPLNVNVWDNLTSQQMCHLYEKLNSGTVVLSKQELLASSTFHTRYFPADLPHLFDRLMEWKRNYYGEMTRLERLSLETVDVDSMSTFEVLTCFQMYLHSVFGGKATNGFIETYSSENKNLVFELYHEMKLSMEEKCADMNHFLTGVFQACEIVHHTYQKMYEESFSFSRRFKLKAYPAKLLVMFVMLHPSQWKEDAFHTYLRRVCVYHDLLNDLVDQHEEKLTFQKKDALSNQKGKFAHNTLRELHETGQFSTEADENDVSQLMQILLQQDVAHVQKSRKNHNSNTLKMVCITSFFNYRVPSMWKQEKNAKDHVVPYSSRYRLTVDICRLGNINVIPSRINSARGDSPITNEWVRKNGFKYQEYPDEHEYNQIVSLGRLEDDMAYHEMCDRRERMYFDDLLRMCGFIQ